MSIKAALEYSGAFVPKFFDNMSPFRDQAFYFTGASPYLVEDLIPLVPKGIVAAELSEDLAPQQYSVPETAFVIIGKDNFDEDEIREYVVQMDKFSAFLPQEGFIDLLFGYDWWHDSEHHELLDSFLEHHNGLKYVKSIGEEGIDFEWPSTKASLVIGTGDGQSDYIEQTDLREAGYSIYEGNRRRTDSERKRILDRILKEETLPLETVAKIMAMLCRRYKREGKNTNAIKCYEIDLAYLKTVHYDVLQIRGFRWPST